MIDVDQRTRLSTQADLNGALHAPQGVGIPALHLGISTDITPQTFTTPNPALTPALAASPIPGVTGVILDPVISNDNTVLYRGMRYPEIIRPLALALPNAVNTVDIACHYQTHGDRHFPGGQPPWEKFSKPTQVDRNQVRDAVNRILEMLIRAQK